MGNRIVVVGSINMDLVIRTPRMPAPGETLRGHDFHVIPGGKGANQAVACARLGADVALIGSVGDDDFGRRQQQCLRQERIDLSFLTVAPEHSTGVALIAVDDSGQNSIIISSGANGSITPHHIEAARETISQADMLVCQLEIPFEAVKCAIELAYAHQVPVILNPAPAPDYPLERSLLEQVAYLIPNETEAEALTGREIHDQGSAQEAVARLQSLGAQTVLLTLGEHGILAAHSGTCIHERAVSVEAVDTTAAGDVFVGGLAVALTEGLSMTEAVDFAKHAAALSVTKLGAQSSIPIRREVERFLGEDRA
jgi:ribokinase